MVHAYKKGELDTKSVNSSLLKKIKKIAGGIEDKSAKKFAKTKHKGLPELKEGKIKQEHQDKYKTIKKERQLKYLMNLGYSKGEIESWTGTRTTKSLGWEKPTDRKPKKTKESHKPTFKEFLVEQFTEKQRQILTPPVIVQKIYAEIKRKYGIVKKEVFYSRLADRLNLTPKGLQRLQQLPALQVLPFDDQSQDEPSVARQDPWNHLKQKHSNR